MNFNCSRSAARTVAACLFVAATAAVAAPPQPSEAFNPSFVDGRYVDAIRGQWNLAGYGLYADVGRRSADVYNHAGPLCWRDAALSATGASETFAYFARSPYGDTAFATTREGTQYPADRSRLPASCRSGIDRSTPLYQFDAVAHSLIRLYPFSAEYGVDWRARYAQLRPRAAAARNERELKAVLARFLRDVGDPHVSLDGSVGDEPFKLTTDGKATLQHVRKLFDAQTDQVDFEAYVWDWLLGERAKAIALLQPDSVRIAPGGLMAWGVLDGNVGYISIGAMGGFEEGASPERERELAGQAIDQALQDLGTTQSLIVDVVHNVGGLDIVSAELAARFADRARLAYTKRTHRGGAHPQSFHVAPKGAVRYDRPVYLFAGDMTISAGDIFVLLMRVLPNVTQVGETTVGALSDATVKTLPNGWTLSLSTEAYRDANGVNYEAVGIPPQIAFPIYTPETHDSGYVDALRRTIALAGGQ